LRYTIFIAEKNKIFFTSFAKVSIALLENKYYLGKHFSWLKKDFKFMMMFANYSGIH